MISDVSRSSGSIGGEVAWVKTLVPWLQSALSKASDSKCGIEVLAGRELPYTQEILRYGESDAPTPCQNAYQTDLLIRDRCVSENWWIPRVVIECKLGGVTTHAAQTYSTKAATHKQVHPYLRYGFLMAEEGEFIPSRVIRHGVHFDFIATVRSRAVTRTERARLAAVLTEEIEASRRLHGLFLDRTRNKRRCRLLHRGLRITD